MWNRVILLLLALLMTLLHLSASLPRVKEKRLRQKKLLTNKYLRGIPKDFFRGPKPPLKPEQVTLLIPFTKWKSVTCSTKKNMYTLKSPKCEPKRVDRGLCFGQCGSIFIPGQNLHYSSACLPVMQRVPVEMSCTGNDGGIKAKRIKFYEKVVACSCKKVKVDWKQVVREIRSQFEFKMKL